MNRIVHDPLELMRLHIEALYTHDARGRLVRVNEPNGGPAPRFFVGRTERGALLRFRHDVDDETRRALELAASESLDDASRFAAILERRAPIERTEAGPAFYIEHDPPSSGEAMLIDESNARVLERHLAAWLGDVTSCAPMMAFVLDGDAVALCASVRRTPNAHEAGVETAPAFRRRGYAATVVASWAREVRALERLPLYSTSWQNAASRAVAARLRMTQFGSDLHFT